MYSEVNIQELLWDPTRMKDAFTHLLETFFSNYFPKNPIAGRLSMAVDVDGTVPIEELVNRIHWKSGHEIREEDHQLIARPPSDFKGSLEIIGLPLVRWATGEEGRAAFEEHGLRPATPLEQLSVIVDPPPDIIGKWTLSYHPLGWRGTPRYLMVRTDGKMACRDYQEREGMLSSDCVLLGVPL